jgi:hypothetical protein
LKRQLAEGFQGGEHDSALPEREADRAERLVGAYFFFFLAGFFFATSSPPSGVGCCQAHARGGATGCQAKNPLYGIDAAADPYI